jgi:DNA-binding transcriptional MerR regulator
LSRVHGACQRNPSRTRGRPEPESNETLHSAGLIRFLFDSVIRQCHIQDVSETWTLSELVAEAATRLEALPPPKNGQVRAVPDERTIRYYAALGLLDRPAAMRGRTALYERRHLAQVVAIKRMQSAGHSLADIQRMWSTLDDVTLGRMSGVQVSGGAGKAKAARKDFWKREPEPKAQAQPHLYPRPVPAPGWAHHTGHMPAADALPAASSPATTINVPLDANISIVIALSDDAAVSLTPADVRALRAAAAPLVAELAKRGLIVPPEDTLEEP